MVFYYHLFFRVNFNLNLGVYNYIIYKNTKEALEKAKSIVDRLVVTNINKYKSNKKLNDQSRRIKPLPMAYIFMLAINQVIISRIFRCVYLNLLNYFQLLYYYEN